MLFSQQPRIFDQETDLKFFSFQSEVDKAQTNFLSNG